MEKKLFVLLIASLAFIFSCNNSQHTKSTAIADSAVGIGDSSCTPGTDSFCSYMPKDSADKMINSYLTSINASANDTDLYSVIIDVKALNDYLKETSSTGAKACKIKMMFAHTLNYINSGGQNQRCGYQTGKLTFVLATYDSAGNYIYKNGTSVMDHLQPCPAYCPSGTGTATNNILP